VVVERSDPHPAGLGLAALATALLGSALLEGFLPWSSPPLLLVCQIGLGAAGALGAALLPDLQRLFVSSRRAAAVADEQAFQEFYRLGLHRTEGRTGVLLFVSLFERRVVVLADEGISSRVEDGEWQATRDAILRGIRDGSLSHGLSAGIGHAGLLLAREAPWQHGDRNQLPDRLIVRRQ
jgi:putative membrane protein